MNGPRGIRTGGGPPARGAALQAAGGWAVAGRVAPGARWPRRPSDSAPGEGVEGTPHGVPRRLLSAPSARPLTRWLRPTIPHALREAAGRAEPRRDVDYATQAAGSTPGPAAGVAGRLARAGDAGTGPGPVPAARCGPRPAASGTGDSARAANTHRKKFFSAFSSSFSPPPASKENFLDAGARGGLGSQRGPRAPGGQAGLPGLSRGPPGWGGGGGAPVRARAGGVGVPEHVQERVQGRGERPFPPRSGPPWVSQALPCRYPSLSFP